MPQGSILVTSDIQTFNNILAYNSKYKEDYYIFNIILWVNEWEMDTTAFCNRKLTLNKTWGCRGYFCDPRFAEMTSL